MLPQNRRLVRAAAEQAAKKAEADRKAAELKAKADEERQAREIAAAKKEAAGGGNLEFGRSNVEWWISRQTVADCLCLSAAVIAS